MTGPVHLDVSRLIVRGVRSSPTGIDRVELAYARRLFGAGVPLRPVAFLGGALRPVDPGRFAGYLDRLAVQWAAGAREGGGAETDARVLAFLAGGPGGPYRAPPQPSPLAGLRRAGLDRLDTARLVRDRLLRLPPRLAARPGERALYLNVSHHHLEKPETLATFRGGAARKVVYVHDLIPLDFPEYCRAGDDAKHRRRMLNVARDADLVLVNSAATAERFTRFAHVQGRRDLPVAVAPLGLDLVPAGEPPPAAAGPYFLVVGTIEARKNHLLLLNVWRRLVESRGPEAPRLVVVGRRGWEIEAVVDMLERAPALKGHVLEAGPVGDRLLGRLMAGAAALLMPSFAEGFGLPVVEALAAGVPAIASDIPVHREVAGGAAELIDPLDAPAWARAILAYAAPGSPERAAQIDRLAGFRAPSWDAHFATVGPLLGLALPGERGSPAVAAPCGAAKG